MSHPLSQFALAGSAEGCGDGLWLCNKSSRRLAFEEPIEC
uniref:Uncharacterized protein n=1 Tax=Anguilla anguilla TaxID=7936 RepID=A0A0E9URA6_ANGAN